MVVTNFRVLLDRARRCVLQPVYVLVYGQLTAGEVNAAPADDGHERARNSVMKFAAIIEYLQDKAKVEKSARRIVRT